jgi:hypothetical protein
MRVVRRSRYYPTGSIAEVVGALAGPVFISTKPEAVRCRTSRSAVIMAIASSATEMVLWRSASACATVSFECRLTHPRAVASARVPRATTESGTPGTPDAAATGSKDADEKTANVRGVQRR